MANEEKKLLDEAAQLLADIALNKSGLTTDHTDRAVEFIAKVNKAKATSNTNDRRSYPQAA